MTARSRHARASVGEDGAQSTSQPVTRDSAGRSSRCWPSAPHTGWWLPRPHREVPWRCHGGAVEVPWRCRGGAMEGPWRCHGGAAVKTDARSMSYRSFRLPPHRNIRSHPSPSSSLCISHRRCAAEAGTRRDGDRSRVERRSSRREKNWWSARPRRGPGVAEIERFRPGIDRSAI